MAKSSSPTTFSLIIYTPEMPDYLQLPEGIYLYSHWSEFPHIYYICHLIGSY